MPALSFTAADGQRYEFPLNVGVTRIGRIDGNDILVPDDSVAEAHCEVHVDNGQVYVRDLNSLTGTAINGSPVSEGPLLPGESLRLGNIEFFLQDAALAPAAYADPPPEPQLVPGEACRYHPTVAAKWRCTKCGELNCDACVTDGRALGVPGVKFCRSCKSAAAKVGARPAVSGKAPGDKTFVGEMTRAWAYPFRRDGLTILIAGAIFFGLANIGMGYVFLIGGMIYVMTTGYLMAYSQSVIQTTAQGEDDPPTWPDFSDFMSDILAPFFQAAGLFIAYLLPSILAVIYLPKNELQTYLLAGLLLLVGLFMMPMAWLAISMHESIMGLSPHFVMPSILRIPAPYFAVFIELVLLVVLNGVIEWIFDQVRIPFLGAFINAFLTVYFLMVISRLLGSLYYLNRNRLGWF